jgi:DNA-binding protein HU-beta
MNRAELVDALIDRMELSRRDANEVVNALFNASEGIIARALKKGDRVAITGFGVFGVRRRNARQARNPQTGEAIRVPAGTVPAFKAGAGLKATVSNKRAAAKGGAGAAARGGRGGAKAAAKRR